MSKTPSIKLFSKPLFLALAAVALVVTPVGDASAKVPCARPHVGSSAGNAALRAQQQQVARVNARLVKRNTQSSAVSKNTAASKTIQPSLKKKAEPLPERRSSSETIDPREPANTDVEVIKPSPLFSTDDVPVIAATAAIVAIAAEEPVHEIADLPVSNNDILFLAIGLRIVIGALFALLAILLYTRLACGSRVATVRYAPLFYLCAIAAFTLAVCANPYLVALPALLYLQVAFQHRLRWNGKFRALILPLVALSVFTAVLVLARIPILRPLSLTGFYEEPHASLSVALILSCLLAVFGILGARLWGWTISMAQVLLSVVPFIAIALIFTGLTTSLGEPREYSAAFEFAAMLVVLPLLAALFFLRFRPARRIHLFGAGAAIVAFLLLLGFMPLGMEVPPALANPFLYFLIFGLTLVAGTLMFALSCRWRKDFAGFGVERA